MKARSAFASCQSQVEAGHHRVAACRALGWTEIDAIIIETTERLQADLIEIDENLCRSELTAGQRSSFTKRRKSIWEALHPVNMQRVAVLDDGEIQVGQVVPPEVGYGKPPPQTKSFASETAAITGESKRDVNRHIARADALGDDLDCLVGPSLDKGVELVLKALDWDHPGSASSSTGWKVGLVQPWRVLRYRQQRLE